MQKILVIGGPTSSGKTALSIRLAKALDGEIISADSRQVYRGLDLGTGKVTAREMHGIPHHLLDVADPRKTFSAGEYVLLARKAIADIIARGRVPIVVGGTGFYIDALLGTVVLPDVSPNERLRKMLQGKNLAWLQGRLKRLDPRRYKEIDTKNPVRLIRAIEIATALGAVPKPTGLPLYDVFYIGIALPKKTLEKKIQARLKERLKKGMVKEAKHLHGKGVSWKRMEELGLEYRYMARHLQGKITRNEMTEELGKEIIRYAKRQMTWFKKNKHLRWYTPSQGTRIMTDAKRFLKLRNKAV